MSDDGDRSKTGRASQKGALRLRVALSPARVEGMLVIAAGIESRVLNHKSAAKVGEAVLRCALAAAEEDEVEGGPAHPCRV